MNSSWFGYRLAFGLLGLLAALPELVACSEHDARAPANAGGSPPNTAGAPGGAASFGVAGMAGASSIAGASASAAGALGQAGFTASAGAGGTNTGGASATGLGGSAAAASGGSAGTASNSAGQGNSGSSGNAGSGGSSAAFARVSTILGKNCGLAGCHADKQSPRLAPGALLYATLTGPNTVLAECDYTKLVEAGDPSQSALVRLMNRKCGSFTMPPSCNKTTCLSAEDLTALSDWIQAGAPP